MIKGNVWEEYIKPSKLFGNLYFIGIRAVCTHLIDTGEGLIIIDPGYSESLHIIVNNIWELGFKTSDIKYIIVSHAHLDHMDSVAALVAMTGAKTFIGKDDLPLLTGEKFHYALNFFKPDVLLEDGDIISLGNTNIKCVSTPGHTDGTMSFFFDVTDGEKTYRAGMFGGAGTNTLRKDFLTKNNLPFENRQKFIDSINKIKNEKVELFLGNHLANNHTEEKLSLLNTQTENPFIQNSQQEWEQFLDSRLTLINNIIQYNL
ncbi:MAG: MBL fold metallo-hydrolase [Clostridia bacterium]|nr:MBL fold metallo-hydrolase [Clostridia bacterium]